MRRLVDRFAAVKAEKRAALIPFIMGGDPDLATASAVLNALPQAGADIIEIGIPFSDPMADGPVIQAAGRRALGTGTRMKDILRMVEEFRSRDAQTPVILMGYVNPVHHYGIARFCRDAARAGVDGMILVDLPPEEEAEIKAAAQAAGLALIRLVAPSSPEQRLPKLLQHAQGFVYYISVAGITGAQSADLATLQRQVERLKAHTALPVAVGFGIKTPEQAAAVGKFADAVVVGSALVNVIAGAETMDAAVRDASAFVQSLRMALTA
ncbi:MAG: tryptophan synthase subunit alpha [Alphaproteobacteria bacterium]|nr:tryptophan synthase subunit alpha [Alphaproteobacteria bacterium]